MTDLNLATFSPEFRRWFSLVYLGDGVKTLHASKWNSESRLHIEAWHPLPFLAFPKNWLLRGFDGVGVDWMKLYVRDTISGFDMEFFGNVPKEIRPRCTSVMQVDLEGEAEKWKIFFNLRNFEICDVQVDDRNRGWDIMTPYQWDGNMISVVTEDDEIRRFDLPRLITAAGYMREILVQHIEGGLH